MSKLKSHQNKHALKSLCCETCSNIYERVDKFNNHVKRCKGKVDNADNDIYVSMVNVMSVKHCEKENDGQLNFDVMRMKMVKKKMMQIL